MKFYPFSLGILLFLIKFSLYHETVFMLYDPRLLVTIGCFSEGLNGPMYGPMLKEITKGSIKAAFLSFEHPNSSYHGCHRATSGSFYSGTFLSKIDFVATYDCPSVLVAQSLSVRGRYAEESFPSITLDWRALKGQQSLTSVWAPAYGTLGNNYTSVCMIKEKKASIITSTADIVYLRAMCHLFQFSMSWPADSIVQYSPRCCRFNRATIF